MTFTKSMRELVRASVTALKLADEEVAKVENNSYLKGSQRHSEELAKAKHNRELRYQKAISDLEQMRTKYEAEIQERYMPHGEDLTPDVAIFQSDISLSSEEISTYLEKYKDNLTMRRYICDYARQKNIDIPPAYTYFSKEDKKIGADKLLSYCKTALNDELYRTEVIENDSNYLQVCGVALADD